MGTKTEKGNRRFECIARLRAKRTPLTEKQQESLDKLVTGEFGAAARPSRRRAVKLNRHKRCPGCGPGGHSRTRSIVVRTPSGVMARV